ncbi:unnamed protein product [Symbiodinium microadriaticum]|nr:unnamed protein product [Symbiodinium microadriaticum]CAE7937921.1 unnamed protein product [Symbiodinium sp. KB8]
MLAGEATVAYLADTSRPRWLGGWALIARSEGFRPALRRVPGRGSWEVGGCYRVNGNPVVRSHVALESEPLCELKGAAEEVLLLELRLAISDDEPRLRGRVRTDSGAVGWLTLELPQEAPLLKPMNLLRKEAIVRSLWPFPVPAALDMAFAVGARREKRRPPVKSTTVAVYPWDVGGVYRTLAKLPITELPDEANPIGWLRAGKKVKVEAIEPGVQGQLKLRVQVESGTLAGCIGWMTTSIAPKDCCLDLRDQTEFEQVMDYWRKIAETGPAASSEAGACYTVRLQRQAGQALGLETIRLEQREGSFITLVENVLEGGPVSEWNKASPDCAVRRGDRILTVNGLDGEAMLNEMKRCEVMYMRLLRSTDGPGAAADVAEPESEAAVAMSLSAPVAPVAAVASESDSASHRRRRFPSAPERDSDEEIIVALRVVFCLEPATQWRNRRAAQILRNCFRRSMRHTWRSFLWPVTKLTSTNVLFWTFGGKKNGHLEVHVFASMREGFAQSVQYGSADMDYALVPVPCTVGSLESTTGLAYEFCEPGCVTLLMREAGVHWVCEEIFSQACAHNGDACGMVINAEMVSQLWAPLMGGEQNGPASRPDLNLYRVFKDADVQNQFPERDLHVPVDLSLQLKCDIELGEQWLLRDRQGFPPKNLVRELNSGSVRLVPTGSPKSCEPWRLCFPAAEIAIADAMGAMHRQAMQLLKLLRDKYASAAVKLSSFHIKNALFWVAEAVPPEGWSVERLSLRLRDVWAFLRKAFQEGHFPQYFWSGRNILDTLTQPQIAATKEFLEKDVMTSLLCLLKEGQLRHSFGSQDYFVIVQPTLSAIDALDSEENGALKRSTWQSMQYTLFFQAICLARVLLGAADMVNSSDMTCLCAKGLLPHCEAAAAFAAPSGKDRLPDWALAIALVLWLNGGQQDESFQRVARGLGIKPGCDDDGSLTRSALVQWRLEKTALAQQMRVDEVPKRGGRLEMTENGSDWKPFYEGPVEETGGGGDCPCRSCRSRCQEEEVTFDGLARLLLWCSLSGFGVLDGLSVFCGVCWG